MARIQRPRSILDNVNVALRNGMGIRLWGAEYDALIAMDGTYGEYRKHLRCPCLRDGQAAAPSDCPHCQGTGRVWPAELRHATYAFDSSRQAQATLVHAGLWSQGQVQVTFPTAIEPSFGDQWWPEGEEMTVEETFQRDARHAQQSELNQWMGYGTVPQGQTPVVVRLKYERPCCFEAVSYVDPDTGALVLARDWQYEVSPDRVWTWRSGGPRPGDFWTVRYRVPAAYQIHTIIPRFRSHAGHRLPYAAQAIRIDKLTRGPDGDIRT